MAFVCHLFDAHLCSAQGFPHKSKRRRRSVHPGYGGKYTIQKTKSCSVLDTLKDRVYCHAFKLTVHTRVSCMLSPCSFLRSDSNFVTSSGSFLFRYVLVRKYLSMYKDRPSKTVWSSGIIITKILYAGSFFCSSMTSSNSSLHHAELT